MIIIPRIEICDRDDWSISQCPDKDLTSAETLRDVDWRHKDTKWPQLWSTHPAPLTPVLCMIFPWLGTLSRSYPSQMYHFFPELAGQCLFAFVCFPTKTLVTLVFLCWSSNLSLNSERSNYENSFVRLFWSSLQFFFRRKTSQSSPLDLKLDGMAEQGLDWGDNKILTNTKHDHGEKQFTS